jgi:hypothetical protein
MNSDKTPVGVDLWFEKQVINVTWFARVHLNKDGTIDVMLHDSLHNHRQRDRFPKVIQGTFRMLEGPGRIVDAIELDSWRPGDRNKRTYTVRNPMHVFSYPKFDEGK